MINFFHRLFNPHCEHCKEEQQENRVCSSCETLREQLRIANHTNEQLISRLLEKPTVEATQQRAPQMASKPTMVPWNVRRQMLEQEDRAKAVAMKNAAQPNPEGPVQTIAEIEKELGLDVQEEAKENV